jgi:hypothetical protein
MWTYKYRSCGLRRARISSSQPTTHQRVDHESAETAMAEPSTANKTNDIARHTPFVALRKPLAPFLCRLRFYAGSCTWISEKSTLLGPWVNKG